MKTAIGADPNNAKAIVDEANNGLKAVPVELVTKAADDSTFTQVGASNPLQVAGNVSLTGRNVEEVMLFNAIAFTDTTYKTSGTKDISKYREFSLLFTNSHDQTINLTFQIGSTSINSMSTSIWNGTIFASKSIAIPPGGAGRFYFKMDDLGITRMPQKILFVLTPAAAPTTGSITGVLMGVPN
jgi:hypothetical protein